MGLLACSGALAQQKPLTWKDSWYTKVTPPENDFAARSGFEEENLAYPANSVGAAQQSTAASAALQLMQTAPANSRP
ncbi:MAG: hypothetical protein KGJ52_01990, partial [Gammaproteobacteria bacterium]|nr:hypothetical protein [Gammaproteobacteria bacterium]